MGQTQIHTHSAFMGGHSVAPFTSMRINDRWRRCGGSRRRGPLIWVWLWQCWVTLQASPTQQGSSGQRSAPLICHLSCPHPSQAAFSDDTAWEHLDYVAAEKQICRSQKKERNKLIALVLIYLAFKCNWNCWNNCVIFPLWKDYFSLYHCRFHWRRCYTGCGSSEIVCDPK